MIYPGKNLFITRNGVVIYGAKSCSINVESDLIETAGPNSGKWREYLAGRMEWDLTVAELVGSPEGYNAKIVAVSSSHTGLATNPENSYIQGPTGTKSRSSNRGVFIAAYTASGTLYSSESFDTYGTEDECDNLASEINGFMNNANVKLIAMCSVDAIGLNEYLLGELDDLGVDSSGWLPAGNYEAFRGAIAVVAARQENGDWNAMAQFSRTSGAPIHAEIFCRLNPATGNSTQTPLRDTLLSVGETYNIAVQVDGFPTDRLTGKAICQKAAVTASLGNLTQGSFKFKGTGALY